MGFLPTTDQYVSDFDDYSIVPWKFEEDFVQPWDQVAEVCRFRKFVDAKSRAASRKRLSSIIYANSALLGGSKKTSREVLTVRFLEHWIDACDYIRLNHANDAEGLEVLGQRYTITMGCWQFLTPDISNIIHLAGLRYGDEDALAELEIDKKRRQAKAASIKKLAAHWKEVERKIGYLLKNSETIDMLEPAVVEALSRVEEEVEFLAEGQQR